MISAQDFEAVDRALDPAVAVRGLGVREPRFRECSQAMNFKHGTESRLLYSHFNTAPVEPLVTILA